MAEIDNFMAEYGVALAEAARLGAEADHQEHLRKVVMAEQALEIAGATTQTALERGRASKVYAEQLERVRDSKAAAETAQAKCVHMAARLEVWRTKMSTERERMRHAE